VCRALAHQAGIDGQFRVEVAARHLADQVSHFPPASSERVSALLALAFEVSEQGPHQHHA
jgi:hypothetical protein